MASELHDQLCMKAAKFLKNNGFAVSFDDRFEAATGSGEIPDAMGFRNGVSCLVEVKVSRSDFLKDKSKRFRINPELGMGDWRFYLCPPDLIRVEELPAGWGLLYAYPNQIKKVHGFPSNTQWGNKPFTAAKQTECDYLYSALRRVALAGHLDSIYTAKQFLKGDRDARS